MTCIAYRNGVMAGETLSAFDNVKNLHFRKIAKRRGYLLGMCGEDIPALEDAVQWFFDGGTGSLEPHKFDMLAVTPEGVIQLWDHRGCMDVLQKPYFAIGSGHTYALGCMFNGGDAITAVRAAMEFSPSCGGRIIVRRL